MSLTWSNSATDHGIARADALHAVGNAVHQETVLDGPAPPVPARLTLYVGPQRDLGAALLEVLVDHRSPTEVHVVHVMPARR